MGAKVCFYRVEILGREVDARAVIGQYVVEVLSAKGARNPTTPTGAGVTQYAVEVLACPVPQAKVSQHVVEALCDPVNLVSSVLTGEPAGEIVYSFSFIS